MKAILLIILSIIFFISWWLFCYRPINNEILFYKSNINTLNVQKKKCLESKIYCEDIKKEIANLNQKLNDSQENLNQIISCIIQIISKNKLNIESSCDKKATQNSYYCKNPYEFKITGKFINIINFFDEICALYKFIEFENLSLKKEKANIISCIFSVSILSLNKQ